MADANPAVGHHFADLEQQQESNLLGMWTFLATEVLFFGGLFAIYLIYRTVYPQAFVEGSHHLDVVLGTINTAILLTSSLTVVLAVAMVQRGETRRSALLLVATIVLGTIFLGIKGYEYFHKFEEGLIPGVKFTLDTPNPGPVMLFFILYFVMTGLHAIHMIIGIGVVAYVAWRVWHNRYAFDYMPVEMLALYWHFVDIVWIFLFPLLYLVSRS